MSNSHIAHNCEFGVDVTIVSGALLAGYVRAGPRAMISGKAAIHRFVRIGELSMVSGPGEGRSGWLTERTSLALAAESQIMRQYQINQPVRRLERLGSLRYETREDSLCSTHQSRPPAFRSLLPHQVPAFRPRANCGR